MPPKEPVMPASIVLTATEAARSPPLPDSASVEPGLNPNQPNARMKQPQSTHMMSCPGMALAWPSRVYLPMRGPRINAQASAVIPPTEWTTPEPAKSAYPCPRPKFAPSIASQPPPHAQLAKIGYVNAPRNIVDTMNAEYFQRSQHVPVTIVVVVSMNTIWNRKITITATSYVPWCIRR